MDNFLRKSSAPITVLRHYPGRQLLWIDPVSATAILLGHAFPRPSMSGYIAAFYNKFGATSLASVKIPAARLYFWLADAEAITVVSSDRYIFQKDVVQYKIVNIYGENVLTSEGHDWKRHRLIAMSAFNEANVALVWAETMRIMHEWFEQLDAAGSMVSLNILQPITQITLLIIASAGFGKRLSLTPNPSADLPPGCKLTFQSAVVDSVDNVALKAVIPKWFYQFSWLINVPYLSSRAQTTQLAFDDLRVHMLDLVASARVGIASGKHSSATSAALLRNLVEANTNQDENSKKLTDDELLSDIFTFLFAGHGQYCHPTYFAWKLMTHCRDFRSYTLVRILHCWLSSQIPSKKLYEEVARMWPADISIGQLTINHKEYMDKLEYTLACIRETLRLFPVAPRLPRVVCEDAVLPGTYFIPASEERPTVETGKFSMDIPKGSIVVMDIWAMHLNLLYWGEDASEFRPERFIDTESYRWRRDAFIPFSSGPRSCIGQRFGIAEMIGILASIVHRYQILCPDDLATELLEKQREALLAWTNGITMTPLNTRVKLSRRF